MVGTFRDTELTPGHPLPELLADLERDRPVPRLRLGGMDEREVAALIGSWHGRRRGRHRARDPRGDRAATRSSSSSSCATSRRSAAARAWRERRVRRARGRARRHRAARRPPARARPGACSRVAALIGRDFDLDLLERVVDLAEDELLDVLDAAVRGALLAEVPSTPGRYSFAHALLRTTLEEELSATRRARLHRRIGEAIEPRHGDRLEPWLDELARHFGAAGPRRRSTAPCDYAVRAAAQATARLAYDEAVRLLAGAVRAAPARRARRPGRARPARDAPWPPPRRARAGGRRRARASPAPPTRRAPPDAGDAFARAALGHAGGTWERYGREDPASVALLEEALERLPEGDSPLRAQVLARLAVLLYFSRAGRPRRCWATPTRRWPWPAGSATPRRWRRRWPAAQYARWRPGRAAERLALADELDRADRGARDAGRLRPRRTLWRACALLELCRLDEADAHLARHARAGRAPRSSPSCSMHRDALRSMRALLEGDYAAARRRAREVLEWGERVEADGRRPLPMHAQYYARADGRVLNERDELGRLTPRTSSRW